MSDQWFKGLPVAGSLAAGCFQQTEQPGRAPGVQSGQHQTVFAVFELNVVGAHQLTRCDVDQAISEYVGSQQHFTVPALEPTQVNLVVHHGYPAWIESLNRSAPDEHSPAADGGDDAGHQRVGIRTTEPHNDVVNAADSFAGRRYHGGAQ